MKKKPTAMAEPLSADRLDALHDVGEDMSAHTDVSKGARPGRAVKRVNVDIAVDLLREIDQEARRLGLTRQAFINVCLADALMEVGQ